MTDYSRMSEEQKERAREYARRYYWKHREERLAYMRERDNAHYQKANRKSRAKLKAEVYSHYGDKCGCCGEANLAFLTIEHLNGGGRAHRRVIGGSATSLLYDIKKRDFPPEFEILCFNCNCGKARNGGVCPHKE